MWPSACLLFRYLGGQDVVFTSKHPRLFLVVGYHSWNRPRTYHTLTSTTIYKIRQF